MLDLRHLADIEDEEKVVPCEVSILEYSIEQGLGRVIHKFINPGRKLTSYIVMIILYGK